MLDHSSEFYSATLGFCETYIFTDLLHVGGSIRNAANDELGSGGKNFQQSIAAHGMLDLFL